MERGRSADRPNPPGRARPTRERRPGRARPFVAAAAIAVVAGTWALTSCSSGTPVPSDPKLAQGQEIFNKNCVACHGAGGGGGTAPRLIGIGNRMSEEQEIAKITNGVSGTAMPAWGSRLSTEEIAAVAAYTRSLTAS